MAETEQQLPELRAKQLVQARSGSAKITVINDDDDNNYEGLVTGDMGGCLSVVVLGDPDEDGVCDTMLGLHGSGGDIAWDTLWSAIAEHGIKNLKGVYIFGKKSELDHLDLTTLYKLAKAENKDIYKLYLEGKKIEMSNAFIRRDNEIFYVRNVQGDGFQATGDGDIAFPVTIVNRAEAEKFRL